jgi:hypothetical protein
MKNNRSAIAAVSLALAAVTLTALGARFFHAGSARRAAPPPGAAIARLRVTAMAAAPAKTVVPARVAAARLPEPRAARLAQAVRQPLAFEKETERNENETMKGRFRERMSATGLGDQLGEGPRDGYANWFYSQRAYPASSIPPGALSKALESAVQNNGGLRGALGDPATPPSVPASIAAATWVPLGPDSIPNGQTDTTASPVSGRVSAIAVHPTNSNIVYVGGAQGGVWKTSNALSATPTWTPLTDHQASLAVGDIAIDPVNPNIIYVGTGESNGSCDSYYGRGILRSADGGATWTQLGATVGGPFDSQAISRILIDPATAGSTTTTTLWASTVSGFLSSGTEQCSFAPGPWNGAVWRSTDSGATWVLQNVPTGTTTTPGAQIHDMVLDPTDGNILYVAVRPVPTASNGGVWKSSNAKGSPAVFAKLAGFPDATTADPGYRRIALTIGGSAAHNTLYAAMQNSTQNLWGLYKSTDAGVTWNHVDNAVNGTCSVTSGSRVVTRVTGPSFTSAMVGHRIIVANSSRTITSFTDGDHVNVRTSEAAFPTTLPAAPWSVGTYPHYCDGQCFYDMSLAADPTDATAAKVYVGGNPNTLNTDLSGGSNHSVWRSDDGGLTWRSISQGNGTGGVHTDDHKIAFDTSTTPARVYDGNDGGLWRSSDQGASWVTMNTNLAITQFQSVGLHPSNRSIILGGTQDNGTNIMNSAFQPPPKWFHADGGDGGQSFIDQSTPTRMFHTYFNQAFNFMGPAKNTTSGSGSWTFVGAYAGFGGVYYNGMTPTDPVSFYAPMASHPAYTPNVVYFGSNKLYRASDPQPTLSKTPSWTAKSPVLTAGGNAFLSAIGVLPNLVSLKEVIYTGASDGRISVSSTVDGTSAVPSWTTISALPLPARFVTEIEVDSSDATGNTAIAAFSGFNVSTPSQPGHVFRTINGLSGSATWTNLSGDLPDVPVNALAIDPTKTPHVLYAGTDIGVFMSVNNGTNWTYLSNGHPNVAVFGLDRNPSTGQIVSSTHGRGMFELISNGLGTAYYTLAPCRVADTRNAAGPSGGPALAASTVRTFPVSSICGIPASATAVAVNLAVFLPSDNGDLRVYPAGTTAPLASAINFRPGIVRANNAIVPLGAGGMLSVQCDMPSGATNFFFDVYGYFQ